jgi:hypothetical protein
MGLQPLQMLFEGRELLQVDTRHCVVQHFRIGDLVTVHLHDESLIDDRVQFA